MLNAFKTLQALSLAVLLTACGFVLKGAGELPFETLYTNIDENSAFGANLRRALRAASPGLRLVQRREEAHVILTQLGMTESRREIALSPDGRVEEYELTLVYSFELTTAQGEVLLPATTLETHREIPYDPDALQAKQGEISNLFVEMRHSLNDRIIRRLTAPGVQQRYRQLQLSEHAGSPSRPAAPSTP